MEENHDSLATNMDDGSSANGIVAYKNKDYQSAISALEPALSNLQDDWKARICLGLSYFHSGDTGKSISTFQQLLEHCDDQLIKSRSQQALELLSALPPPPNADTEKSGDASPTQDKVTLCKWGVQAYFGGNYETAVKYLEPGLSDNYENWNARVCLGMSYQHLDRLAEAQAIFSHIMADCTDAQIGQRAKQAMEMMRLDMAAPADGDALDKAFAAATAGAPHKSPAFEQSRQSVAFGQDIATGDAKKPRANFGAVALLVFLVFGCLYYAAAQMLPNIYSQIFLKGATGQYTPVASMGTLNRVQAQNVTIPAAHGLTLTGCLYQKPGASRVVLLCPSTSNDSQARRSLAEKLLSGGCSVFLYDNRGAGTSGGKATWEGVVDDGLFAYDYLHGKMGYGGDDIVAYGCAMGAPTAATVAKQRKCHAVVLENPFISAPELARAKMPALAIFPDALCPEPRLDLLEVLDAHPSLLIVQSKDVLVPEAETKKLFDRTKDPKKLDVSQSSASDPHWDSIVKFVGES